MQAEVAAVVLAAGASTRLGHPKALVHFDGKPVLERVARKLAAAGVPGVVVIGRPHADRIRSTVRIEPLTWTVNPTPQAGRLGSLQCGLRATPPGTDVLLWPVDRPLAAASVLEVLLDARGESGEPFVVSPIAEGRRGHPVLLSAAIRERILAEPADANLREILRSSDVHRIDVAVTGAEIHANLDNETEVKRVRDSRESDPPADPR